MPCNCDYMEPNRHEIESVRTAGALKHALHQLGEAVPTWVSEAASSYYGDASRLNEMVVMLCTVCEDMTEKQQSLIIYDGRDEESRKLATWWDAHKKADADRLEKEAIESERERVAKEALFLLSEEQKKALGL